MNAIVVVEEPQQFEAVLTPEECNVYRSRMIKDRHSFRSAIFASKTVGPSRAVHIHNLGLNSLHGTPKGVRNFRTLENYKHRTPPECTPRTSDPRATARWY